MISLENLNIKGIVQERFGKQINDAGWGLLANMLCYKAESADYARGGDVLATVFSKA